VSQSAPPRAWTLSARGRLAAYHRADWFGLAAGRGAGQQIAMRPAPASSCAPPGSRWDRHRPNYPDVKRDLLWEPIFDMKAHRNMAEAVLGRKTVNEIFDEMALQRAQKPQ
jgi:hypothetical protein